MTPEHGLGAMVDGIIDAFAAPAQTARQLAVQSFMGGDVERAEATLVELLQALQRFQGWTRGELADIIANVERALERVRHVS